MNSFFSYTPLAANSVARASDINVRFNGVVTAFDKLPDPELLSEDRATFAVDTGAANALVVAPSVALTAYNTGLRIRTQAVARNTGATTINVSGLGVKQIVRADGTALQAGDITAGQVVDLTYDGTAFRLAMAFAELSPAGVATKLAAAGTVTINGNLHAFGTEGNRNSFIASISLTGDWGPNFSLYGNGGVANSLMGHIRGITYDTGATKGARYSGNNFVELAIGNTPYVTLRPAETYIANNLRVGADVDGLFTRTNAAVIAPKPPMTVWMDFPTYELVNGPMIAGNHTIPTLLMGYSNSSTKGVQEAIGANQNPTVGLVRFNASDGTSFREVASISAQVGLGGTPDGQPLSGGGYPGRLRFYVGSAATGGTTEVFRLEDGGANILRNLTVSGDVAATKASGPVAYDMFHGTTRRAQVATASNGDVYLASYVDGRRIVHELEGREAYALNNSGVTLNSKDGLPTNLQLNRDGVPYTLLQGGNGNTVSYLYAQAGGGIYIGAANAAKTATRDTLHVTYDGASIFGNFYNYADDTFFSWDAGTSKRLGISKRSGHGPVFASGLHDSFVFANSGLASTIENGAGANFQNIAQIHRGGMHINGTAGNGIPTLNINTVAGGAYSQITMQSYGANVFTITAGFNNQAFIDTDKLSFRKYDATFMATLEPGLFSVEGAIKPKSYTKATVPSASAVGAGAQIWVSDTGSGGRLCYSTGSSWEYVASFSAL